MSIPYSIFQFAPIISDEEMGEAFPWKVNLKKLQEYNWGKMSHRCIIIQIKQ